MSPTGQAEKVSSKLSPYSPAFCPANLRSQMEQQDSHPYPSSTAGNWQGSSSETHFPAAPLSAPVLPVPTMTQPNTVPMTGAPVSYGQLMQPGFPQVPAYMWVQVPVVQQGQAVLSYGPNCTTAQLMWQPCQSGQPQTAFDSSSSIPQPSLIPLRQQHTTTPTEEELSEADADSSEEDIEIASSHKKKRTSLDVEVEPSYGTGWDSITEPIMGMIVQRLDTRTQQLCRLVSRRWNQYVTNNLQEVQLKRPKVHNVCKNFKSVTSLDMSACENVRNRNLNVLASSSLKLESISIGHVATVAFGKPRVTNAALKSLSTILTLTKLSLTDCSAFTNNGMQVLTALTNLESLAFVRCPRISEKGLEIIQSLPKLRTFTAIGCIKVTDGLLEAVARVSSLESLHIGHLRLQGDSLTGLASQASLRELTIQGEEMSEATLAALGGLSRLAALGLNTCYQITAPVALSMLNDMIGLQRLNLQTFGDLTSEHLCLIAARFVNLQQLKIVMGGQVGQSGIEALGGLTGLQGISIECTQANHMALMAVSSLINLTVAEFPGNSLSLSLLFALTKLPSLEVVNISNYDPQNMLHATLVVRPVHLMELSRISKLKRLDVSNLIINAEQVSSLLTCLKKRELNTLVELCVVNCPISEEEVQALNALYPTVHIHKNRRKVLPSSTWTWSESVHQQ